MVELEFAPVIASGVGFVLTLAAELLHGARTKRVLRLAFGPLERPAAWVRAVPLLRAAAVAARVMALTGADLLTDAKLLEKVRSEFESATEGKPYRSPVPEDQKAPLP